MLPLLDVVAEVVNHMLVNEGKLEFRDVSVDGFELEYEMLEIEDVVVIKLTMVSFGHISGDVYPLRWILPEFDRCF
ncbi:uncharacterized protein LAESUDRAFT_763519 [Laetiporus sulphureus 93-53]|uniref:Uncharacterized protein n=1 Tax=Laetiporus sulphureus 93-53 TaxID=1314785 RepID=A0A165BU39_9APHY|nr:uncharacterized protein LAESUDRAFT_763519 [Laetiporus sulphureus 93-53]KZT01653.1 hypothetical protein LAESUDRAFT_763519 [Laetiporus sulphureus 93-53]